METEETTPDVPQFTKSPRTLQRSGNLRKNIRKKNSAQLPDRSHSLKVSSSTCSEKTTLVTKSSTVPNLSVLEAQEFSRNSTGFDVETKSKNVEIILDNEVTAMMLVTPKSNGFDGIPSSSKEKLDNEQKTVNSNESPSVINSSGNSFIGKDIEMEEFLEKEMDSVGLCDLTTEGNSAVTQEQEVTKSEQDNPADELNDTQSELQSAAGSSSPTSKEPLLASEDLTSDPDLASASSDLARGVNDLHLRGSLARGVGLLGKAASDAWTFLSTTLETLRPGDVDSDSDVSFHDVNSDVSEEDEVDFVDANEDQKPRDRIHYICNELLTTEISYVERLQVLVKVKKRTSKLLGTEIARQMFHDVETIYTFHSEYLLPTLKDRLKKWGQYEKVGDVMKKLTPFLKLYTEYVMNMQRSTSLVNQYQEKSSAFSALLRKVKEKQSSSCGNQPVQAHMMEPVQRVPRYELLLREYLKHLPDGAADKEDTEEALLSVSRSAKHFEEMIKRDSAMSELLSIQQRLEGAQIVSPNRELVKQGRVVRVKERGPGSERFLYLFSDILLICSKVKLPVITKFKVKQEFNLKEITVIEGTNPEHSLTLCIESGEQSIILLASSEEDKGQWIKALRETIRKHCGKAEDTTSEHNVHNSQESSQDVIDDSKNVDLNQRDEEKDEENKQT